MSMVCFVLSSEPAFDLIENGLGLFFNIRRCFFGNVNSLLPPLFIILFLRLGGWGGWGGWATQTIVHPRHMDTDRHAV